METFFQTYKKVFMASHKKAFVSQYAIKYLSKLHDLSGTHLFGKYNAAGFGKGTSIELDDSYHKPEKVKPEYVNCFFYNDDYSAYIPLCSLLPGYLEIGLPALR